MKEVQDRVVQFSNRYKLTNAETGEVLGTFDFDEVTGTVQQVGTEIDAELFDSIAADLAARVKLSGGELARTIVTFSDISGTAANVASGDTSATLWGKVKNWFSRLKALAFKNKVAAGDFEAGAIKNADVAADAAIAQSKVSGLESALASKANDADLAAIAKSGDLADATQDATHRVVTDTEKATWNAKQNAITGAASTIASQNLTANRALISNEQGKVTVSPVTTTELGYLDGATSNIQTQLNNSGKITSSGGFQGGTGARATFGAAIGNSATAYSGGAIGSSASETSGGGAVGVSASVQSGGAVGAAAMATNGFAGGEQAKATASGAVQLGEGKNNNANTLQFRDYQIVDANGNIPASRLSANSPVRSVNGQTGAVSLSAADVGAATETQVNSVSMVPYGGQATTLSALGTGGVYSISANGFLRIAYQTTAADNYITMKQVNSSGADMWGALSNGQKSYGGGYPFIYMPVAAGDHIKVEFSSSVKIIQVQLIKVKTV